MVLTAVDSVHIFFLFFNIFQQESLASEICHMHRAHCIFLSLQWQFFFLFFLSVKFKNYPQFIYFTYFRKQPLGWKTKGLSPTHPNSLYHLLVFSKKTNTMSTDWQRINVEPLNLWGSVGVTVRWLVDQHLIHLYISQSFKTRVSSSPQAQRFWRPLAILYNIGRPSRSGCNNSAVI